MDGTRSTRSQSTSVHDGGSRKTQRGTNLFASMGGFLMVVLLALGSIVFSPVPMWHNMKYNGDTKEELRQHVGQPTTSFEASNLPQQHLLLPKLSKDATIDKPIVWEIVLDNDASSSMTVCACAKCGSTSLYNTIYKRMHGKAWDFSGKPYIQNLGSQRWQYQNVTVKKQWKWDDTQRENSFALIRDPKERILSAWKSKVMCFKGADVGDRSKIVPGLLKLAGLADPDLIAANKHVDETEKGPCLSLSHYIQVLFQIHSKGKQGQVNEHFRPQHLHCFHHAPPEKWKVVTVAKSPDIMCQLNSVIPGGDKNPNSENKANKCNTTMTKIHTTKSLSAYSNLTQMDVAMLDAITQDEYKVLGSYLT